MLFLKHEKSLRKRSNSNAVKIVQEFKFGNPYSNFDQSYKKTIPGGFQEFIRKGLGLVLTEKGFSHALNN